MTGRAEGRESEVERNKRRGEGKERRTRGKREDGIIERCEAGEKHRLTGGIRSVLG